MLALTPLRSILAASSNLASNTAATEQAAAAFAQPFLKIDTDNTVTVLAKHLDMGQGIWSGLASIVAEELDASRAQTRVIGAPANQALYKNLAFGFQSTGGSTSIANSWEQMRKAGATARAMLVQAAAVQWQVPAEEIRVVDGMVMHGAPPQLRQTSFGQLAEAASKLDVPAEVKLKDPASFRYLGKSWPRLDTQAKSTGATIFGIDVQRPGMKIAVVARPPKFGATLKSFDATAARALKGVVDVVQISSGVAVIADNTWIAINARKQLKIEWDETAAEQRSSPQLLADYKQLADGNSANVALTRGNAEQALSSAAQVVEAEFEFPYLAHAPMEPLCAAGEMVGTGKDRRCTIWAGIQNMFADHRNIAKMLDLPMDSVSMNTLYAGGSFGRRATFSSDWIIEVAEIIKATDGRYPVKLMRTREDDITGGYYRPMALHRIKAGLDQQGNITGLHQTIVTQSFIANFKGKVDPTATDGTAVQCYDIADAQLDWINPPCGVTVWTFRALSHNHTTASKEIFMDELARKARRDPLEFRLQYLTNHPRQAAVLKLAAEKAGWGKRKLKAGHALGLAVQEANNSFVALVAEVAIVDHSIRVERVVCAVDCGYALNPDIVKAQMEGGIGFSLSQALSGKITLKDGLVEQSNFHDYTVLRINEMPHSIEVHILNSGHAPTGVGEPGSVLIPAAVANAVAVLTGKPVRQFPLSGLEL